MSDSRLGAPHRTRWFWYVVLSQSVTFGVALWLGFHVLWLWFAVAALSAIQLLRVMPRFPLLPVGRRLWRRHQIALFAVRHRARYDFIAKERRRRRKARLQQNLAAPALQAMDEWIARLRQEQIEYARRYGGHSPEVKIAPPRMPPPITEYVAGLDAEYTHLQWINEQRVAHGFSLITVEQMRAGDGWLPHGYVSPEVEAANEVEWKRALPINPPFNPRINTIIGESTPPKLPISETDRRLLETFGIIKPGAPVEPRPNPYPGNPALRDSLESSKPIRCKPGKHVWHTLEIVTRDPTTFKFCTRCGAEYGKPRKRKKAPND